MRSRNGVITVGMLAGLLLAQAVTVARAEHQRPAGAQDPQVQAALERQRAGEFHRRLSVFEGQWRTAWTVWHGPGREPSDRATGTAVFRPILGGRFLEGTYAGEGILGMAFEGRLFLGYDTRQGRYTGTWFNSFETSITTYSSSPITELKSGPLRRLALSGRPSPHPKLGETESRVTFSIVDQDEVLEEQFAFDVEGREFRALEVRYVRVRP